MNAFIELLIISDELRLSPFDEIPYMSDGIAMFQPPKIITDLFRISYSYLRRPARVKSKLDDLGPQYPVIEAFNLTFSES
jgi:hypothetical protein